MCVCFSFLAFDSYMEIEDAPQHTTPHYLSIEDNAHFKLGGKEIQIQFFNIS